MTAEQRPATIEATGQSTAPVPCDVAWLRIVLVEEAKIVGEAIERSDARIATVLDRIRETEPRLPETVIEAERKIDPIFDDDGAHETFEVRRVVRAQMPPEPAGMLLDVAIMAGAGPGSHITFGVRDPAAVRAHAIEGAVRVAQANAAAAAQSLGCELGALQTSEVESSFPDEFADPLVRITASARLTYACG